MKGKLSPLYNKLDELNLDALLISNKYNITYLSDFPGEDCYILLKEDKAFFLTDFRNYHQVKQSVKGFEVTQIKETFFKTLPELIKRTRVKRTGFEAKTLDFATHHKLKIELRKHSKLIPTMDLVEDMRQIKEKQEIRLIKRAIKITEEAFKFARKIISPAKAENYIANCLEAFIRKKGASCSSFPIIVAGGRRSAFPHARSSVKKIGNNTAVTIDLGVNFKGYKSDLTRVFFLGRITRDLRRIYEIILQAQDKAIKKIKAGIRAAQIDKEARNFIAQKGFGRFFQHSVGHGVGLEVHEGPFINKINEKPLASGMVITVEPGIYLPNRFGVRIEDMVLVEDEGCEVLSGNCIKSA